MTAARDATPEEMMIAASAAELRDDDVCFVGIGAPSAACNLARLTHAPRITLIYESGTIGARPAALPLSIGDGELCETALTTVSVPEMFRYWLQGGWITVGFLGGAQVDQFANLNTTVIGEYATPRTRLPGGGGAPEIAAHCHRTLIVMKHDRRALVRRVDFVTTFGHGAGGDHRKRLGLSTDGPTRVITDLCVMEPEPERGELWVTELHAGVAIAAVRQRTGWEVRAAPHMREASPPSAHVLDSLRQLRARSGAALPGVQL
jgi:glutaconate CoA-transferase subunit B